MTPMPDDFGTTPFTPNDLTGPYVDSVGDWSATTEGRYRVLGELGRGGMGVVFKAHDPDFGRDVAVKIIRPERLTAESALRDEVLLRFEAEARTAGRLQHPGLVPVYERGSFEGGRSYFTMKLVEGRTLADLLGNSGEPTKDQPRFLHIFEQICQTVAYAHSRRVIHRDLKPANVMVGSYGEVLVMDWGLARDLDTAGDPLTIHSDPTAPSEQGLASRMGWGTLAYMPPEQARGEANRVDECADVFALGAILCQILTGLPPYVSDSFSELRRLAQVGDLSDALNRLNGCGADAELVILAINCLAPEPTERPRDARAVAERISGYLAGVQDRLQQAERDKAAAQARAEEARKRQRLTMILAATLFTLIGAATGGAYWISVERSARQREELLRFADQVARDGEIIATRAETERAGDIAFREADRFARKGRYLEALALLDQALLRTGEAALRDAGRHAPEAEKYARSQRLPESLADLLKLQSRLQKSRDEIRLMANLESARLRAVPVRVPPPLGNQEGQVDYPAVDAVYQEAFRQFGWEKYFPDDFPGKKPSDRTAGILDEAATRLGDPAVRSAVIAGLQLWGEVKANRGRDIAALLRWSLAEVIDKDSWRQNLRTAVKNNDRAALVKLATGPDLEGQPVDIQEWLVNELISRNEADSAERVLRKAQAASPDDFRACYQLGTLLALRKPSHLTEAEGFFRSAVALRPDAPAVHVQLAQTLSEQGRWIDARAAFQRALQLDPNFTPARIGLTMHFLRQGRPESALVASTEAVKRSPDSPMANSIHTGVLLMHHRYAEAADFAARVEKLDPKYPGSALARFMAAREQGDFASARAFMLRRRDLLAKEDPRRNRADEWLKQTQKMATFDARLALYVHDKAKPANPEEHESLEELFRIRGCYAAAARLYARSFAEMPFRADDLINNPRLFAAHVAARAGGGDGRDAVITSEPERQRLRRQAIDWLRADLQHRSRELAKGSRERRTTAAREILFSCLIWKAYARLHAGAVARFPEPDRTQWNKLEKGMDALGEQALVAWSVQPLPDNVNVFLTADDPRWGYSKEKPVRLGGRTIFESIAVTRWYFSQLRDESGQPFTYSRKGNVGEGPSGNIVDHWRLTASDGRTYDVYLDMYHPKIPIPTLQAPCGMYRAK